MDFNLRQWKYEPEEEEYETKPKFAKHHHDLITTTNNNNNNSHYSNSTLPLFLHPPLSPNFSKGQWQELELQALIYRHMIAGADIPPHLLAHLLQNTLLSQYYPLHYRPNTTAAMVQSGYWGKGAMDPEPGRCRRTDGKKWRCSRDVVTGQKYCERHVHRGKNRSRKPVEIPASGGAAVADAFKNNNNQFRLSGPSSIDLLHHLNSSRPLNSSIDETTTTKCTLEGPKDGNRTLRRFFDDWPSSIIQDTDTEDSNTSAAATNLSISMPGGGNSSSSSSSDFSLKLGTGDGDHGRGGGGGAHAARPQMNWWGGMAAWEANRPLGGPLAEALRSSMTMLPKSVLLHQLTRSSAAAASETSYV